MATIATTLRRPDLLAAETTAENEIADSYRLRGLPGDNLYLFSKRIDNSRLVREANPKTRGDCWNTIATACVLAAMVGTAVSPRVASVLTGYQTEKLKSENRELNEQRRAREIAEARLLTPSRLDQLANARSLAAPAAGREQHLQPHESGMAMIIPPRTGAN
ncbi:hypothetical protein [Nevskia soli]|jgi:hypothetical protein|uniref:hypothetical protein n=1 Tax=Nevskia soli TaxID=418856 RepID=UPI0015D6BC4F|nr:hypothetical protein [Nevskia soli]